ncbi:MAG TPA: ankyrin repeat domain-containing protein, partial [Acidobacteriota bacterium]|nr:ankyrin repeat domain-containing protein [Acidobacteriota bacterium]
VVVRVLVLLLICTAVLADESLDRQLVQASRKGDTEQVKRLIAQGANVNTVHAITGWTPLTAASFWAHPETVGVLLHAGANPNAKDRHSGTPLFKAVTLGTYTDKKEIIQRKADVVRLLLAGGADPQLKDQFGDTAWEVAVFSGFDPIVQVFEEFDAKGLRETKLMNAIARKDRKAVNELLSQDANPNYRDGSGANALSEAVLADDPEILSAVIAKGADVNATFGNGWTALMIAASENHPQSVEILLEAKADPNLKDKNGATALKLARATNHLEVVQILVNVGALE